MRNALTRLTPRQDRIWTVVGGVLFVVMAAFVDSAWRGQSFWRSVVFVVVLVATLIGLNTWARSRSRSNGRD